MNHVFLIDPIEKLKLYKDSSLFLATSLKQAGHSVYFLITTDFAISSIESRTLKVYEFDCTIKNDFYMEGFELTNHLELVLSKGDILHFRPDPPVDGTYLNLCWMSQFLKEQYGIKVINDSMGAVSYNEKLLSFKEKNSLPSLVSNNFSHFQEFIIKSKDHSDFIVKPLNLFSGIGVEKYNHSNLDDLKERLRISEDYLMIQPFDPAVVNGEVRSIYWEGNYLGSVLKVPKLGSYLSNTSQGSSIEHYELEKNLRDQCHKICTDLLDFGVKLVAFDILNKNISEVNITCPSLLVELSHIHEKNVTREIITSF